MSKQYIPVTVVANGQEIKTVVDLGFQTTVNALNRIRQQNDTKFANYSEKFRKAVVLKVSHVLEIPESSVNVEKVLAVGSHVAR